MIDEGCGQDAEWILHDEEIYGESFACSEHVSALIADTTTTIEAYTEGDAQCCYLGEEGIDVIEGGRVKFSDGSHIEIPAHSQRIHGDIWHNGAFIEVLFYQEEQPGEDPSDRIHLMVTDKDGNRDGWLMNAEDALSIARGLTTAVAIAVKSNVPLKPLCAYQMEV